MRTMLNDRAEGPTDKPLNSPKRNRTAQGLLAMAAGLIAALLLTGLAWVNNAEVEAVVSDSLLWTGRLAFFAFLIPWLASPLHKLFPGELSRSLMRRRRQAGIVFGSIQVIHLGLIVWLFQIYDSPGVDSATLIVGGTGIALAIAMLITSFDGPLKLVGSRAWKALHRAGLYVCGFIYFFDFLVAPFLADYDLLVYAPLMGLTAAAIALRTMALVRSKRMAGVPA